MQFQRVWECPLMRFWNVKRRQLSLSYKLRFLLPISCGKALAVTFAYMSIWKVPVSYAHTVKATMPLFAVVMSRLILNERQSSRVYLSLVPIMAGVVLASATELSFNVIGLLSALASTGTWALLNTLAKRVYQDTAIHPIALLAITAQISVVILAPFWCLHDAYAIWRGATDDTALAKAPVLPLWQVPLMLFVSGLLSFVQNLLAFTLLHRLTSLSYAVANTAKRITVITVSLATLRNPVTVWNVAGMCMAVCGVFAYNRAKQTQKTKEDPGLSRVMTSATLSDANLVTLPGRFAKLSPSMRRPHGAQAGGTRLDHGMQHV